MRRLLLVFRVFRCYRLLRFRSVRRFLCAQLAFFVAVMLFFFGYRAVVANRGDRELQTVLAELDAKEPRWRWEHIVADRVPLPDDQNGVKVLEELAAQTGIEKVDELDDRGIFLWFDDVEPNRSLRDDRMEIVVRGLATHRQTLPIVRRLRDYPHGFYPLESTLEAMPPPSSAAAASPKALVLLDMEAEQRGNIRAAPEYPRMMMNLERYLEDVPQAGIQRIRASYTKRIVRRIERMLGMGEPQELATLQAEVLQAAESDRFWAATRGDRATLQEIYGQMAGGTQRFSRFAKSLDCDHYYWSRHYRFLSDLGLVDWTYAPRLAADHAAFLRFVNVLLTKKALPERDLWQWLLTGRQRNRNAPMVDYPNGRTVIAHELSGLFYYQFNHHLEAKARLRRAGVGLAAERFRQAEGRWPETLEELCPKYLPAVPLDPFDDLPLKCAVNDEGIAITSVGSDGKEPRDSENRERSFRVFNPDQRALPPLPPMLFLGFDEEGRLIEMGPMPREVLP